MLLSVLLSVQESGGQSLCDFYFVRNTSPWLTSTNAAGLPTLVPERISTVETAFSKADGALTDLGSSDDSWEAGAATESFVRISERIAFSGKLSYSNFRGRNMGGPVLMDPSYNPINFYESTDTTTGIKTRELYTLSGGISYSFGPKWSIGAKIDYQTGNYAKRKDPRFLNSWSDIGLSAGGRFSASEKFSVGANFLYRKTIEKVYGDIFGTTDKQYYILVDYGGFWGSREVLGSDNAHISTTYSHPMYNSFYGAALQLDFGASGNVRFFSELSFLRRRGYYGDKSSTSVMYTEHSGYEASYSGFLTVARGKALHKLTLDLAYKPLDNFENIYREVTVPGQNSHIEYYGQNRTLDRTVVEAGVSYTGYLGVEGLRPEWEYGIDADLLSTRFTAQSYPFYRKQNIAEYSASAFGKKNFFSGDNVFTLRVEAGYAAGTGTEKEDGEYVSSTSTAPFSGDAYLHRDFEYRTAGKVSAGLSFRYTRLFRKGISAYIDLSDRYMHAASRVQYLYGDYRNLLTVTVGCSF